MYIVPPKVEPRQSRTKREIFHDGLCGITIGLIVGIAGCFITGKLFFLLATPIVTILCITFGLLCGKTPNEKIFGAKVLW